MEVEWAVFVPFLVLMAKGGKREQKYEPRICILSFFAPLLGWMLHVALDVAWVTAFGQSLEKPPRTGTAHRTPTGKLPGPALLLACLPGQGSQGTQYVHIAASHLREGALSL